MISLTQARPINDYHLFGLLRYCGSKYSLRLPVQEALVVSTSQAEAANSPTHNTKSPVGLPNTYSYSQAPDNLIILFCFASHFITVILVLTTTPKFSWTLARIQAAPIRLQNIIEGMPVTCSNE